MAVDQPGHQRLAAEIETNGLRVAKRTIRNFRNLIVGYADEAVVLAFRA